MLVLAGLAVAAAVLLSRPDAEPSSAGRTAPEPSLRIVSVPALGLAFRHPASWERTADGQVIRLRSPDGSVVMTFASPVEGREPAAVKRTLERALRRRFAPAEKVSDGRGRLGQRRAFTIELLGEDRSGDRVRALAVVDSTPFRTYAITAIAPARPSARRIEQLEDILGSVSLSEPVPSGE